MVEFRIFGALGAVVGGEELALGSAQQRAVLALLLVRAPEPVSLDRLVDGLWAERPPATAAHAVQVYVSGLRKALRPAADAVAVRSSRVGYVLEVKPEQIDARRFERLITDGQGILGEDPSKARASFEQALTLSREPALAEFEELEWARREADRLNELRQLAFEGLAEARLTSGAHGEVIDTLTRLVADSPLRERPQRLLMLALYRSGRHADALAAYRDACAALDEIGLQPGPELRALEAAILRHDRALVRSEPASGSRPTRDESDSGEFPAPNLQRRSNLPIAAHALVGREKELSLALGLLGRDDIRLVTLVGPGGSGKTRLALEIAAKLADGYRDGAWFVSLAPLTDSGFVASEIARTLGLRETDRPAELTLAEALSEREALVVLDNFEHVLGFAPAVASLLSSSRKVDVLTTSREPLRVRGEHRLDVPPLSLDDAVELFAQRAHEVRHELNIEAEDRDAIERICVRLDQLPLALELAAAWASVFGAPALDARLAARLTLPGAPRDLPERQRSLDATIDWSYRLLESADRALLQSLAPFIGGVRADSAEAIWGPEAVDTLRSLAEKSLLRRREDSDREPRFWMLETIRQFALDRAAQDGIADQASDRHAAHFLALTDEAAGHLDGSEQAPWLERLEDDHANLRGALDHLIRNGSPAAVRMAANLEWFWIIRGPFVEGRSYLAAALESAPDNSPRRGHALEAAGQILLHLADAAEAKPLLADALGLAEREGNARVIALTHSHLGWTAEALGDNAAAIAHHHQAIAAARAADDVWALAIALNNQAIGLGRSGDFEQAQTRFEESLLVGRRIGEPRAIALTANNLAETALILNDFDRAEALINESLAAARKIGARSIIATVLGTKAEISLYRGDVEGARAQVQESAALTRTTYAIQSAPGVLSAAGTLAAILDDPIRAATLWAAAEAAQARVGLADGPATDKLQAQWHPSAQAAADAESWQAAWAAGAEMALDEALALASAD